MKNNESKLATWKLVFFSFLNKRIVLSHFRYFRNRGVKLSSKHIMYEKEELVDN